MQFSLPLATFQMLDTYTQLMTAIGDSTDIEHFHHDSTARIGFVLPYLRLRQRDSRDTENVSTSNTYGNGFFKEEEFLSF